MCLLCRAYVFSHVNLKACEEIWNLIQGQRDKRAQQWKGFKADDSEQLWSHSRNVTYVA